MHFSCVFPVLLLPVCPSDFLFEPLWFLLSWRQFLWSLPSPELVSHHYCSWLYFYNKAVFYSELSLPPQQDRSFCGGTSRRSAACTSWRLFTFRLNFLDTLAVVWNLTVITDSLWICWKFFFFFFTHPCETERLWQLCFWRKSSLDPAMTFTLSKPRNKWKMTYYDSVFNQKYKWSVFMVFSHWAASPDDQ